MTLHLTHAVVSEVVAHAVADAPDEAVGVVVTTGEGLVVRRLPNVAPAAERHHRYDAGAAAVLALYEELDAHEGWSVLAVYHSHPTSPAAPSAVDVEHAALDATYLIYSVSEASLRGWTLATGDPLEVPIAIDDAAAA